MSTQLICHTKGSWILNKPIIQARCGALPIFEGDDYFVTGEEASTEEEQAEDQLILSHIYLALMNNRLCLYEDKESDDDKDNKSDCTRMK